MACAPTRDVPSAVDALVRARLPGAEVVAVTRLGVDTHDDEATTKATGYGRPLRIEVRDANGDRCDLVLHSATANEYGHDRRADRAADMLLAYDTFGDIPQHARAIDVGTVMRDGSLLSLRDAGEMFLLTSWADGEIYADDLRRIAHTRRCSPHDLGRAEALAQYLAALHVKKRAPDHVHRRAVRDLVGSGEGIFGIIDGYPADVPAAPPERLQRIEERCLAWRWKLRTHSERLHRIHGDFHPFNVLFDDEDRVSVLDASRGCSGDPADDLTAMAVNFVFFALAEPGSWREGLGPLWDRFWQRYFEARRDDALLEMAPPYFAWRALVVANPRWYPETSADARDALLGMAERALDRGRLALDDASEVFG